MIMVAELLTGECELDQRQDSALQTSNAFGRGRI
jgi:hypothetical protein